MSHKVFGIILLFPFDDSKKTSYIGRIGHPGMFSDAGQYGINGTAGSATRYSGDCDHERYKQRPGEWTGIH